MNNELIATNNITLLGTTITNTLSWVQHITGIAMKTTKRLYILGRASDLLPQQARITAYKAYIRPLMGYASPIWSGAGTTLLEHVLKYLNLLVKVLTNGGLPGEPHNCWLKL
jgi:hypothetical protein